MARRRPAARARVCTPATAACCRRRHHARACRHTYRASTAGSSLDGASARTLLFSRLPGTGGVGTSITWNRLAGRLSDGTAPGGCWASCCAFVGFSARSGCAGDDMDKIRVVGGTRLPPRLRCADAPGTAFTIRRTGRLIILLRLPSAGALLLLLHRERRKLRCGTARRGILRRQAATGSSALLLKSFAACCRHACCHL